MKVLHLASHEINVGDGALTHAIRARILDIVGAGVSFDLQDVAVFRKELTAAELDSYDLVVVGGGGGISNGPFAARTGTPMPISMDEYVKSKARFAFVGLGHNLFEGDPFRHAEQLKQLLRHVREKGDFFSVRNDGSLARLQRDLGHAETEAVVEIPDPGFFVDAPARRPASASARPYIVVQPAGDSLHLRSPVSRISRVMKRLRSGDVLSPLEQALVQFSLHMWRNHGFDIQLTPHIPHDVPICAAISRALYARAGKDALHRPFRMAGTPHPDHAGEFFGSYAAAQMIVGMRGHAVICGVGLRRPTIALSTHPKVVGFMEDCDLAHWSVPLTGNSADLLIARAEELLNGESRYFADRDKAVADFGPRFDSFMRQVIDSVGSATPPSA
ncbi:hypothetical protein GRI97_08930 [Altererythrobacter xixiisoli]|uniref:Polysaccharide pyruvyl transferase domain-containing protein n=1 Tax=Croceibacterium xixiisoli TaxID=1476466 RepID=A0A6I4TV93_9SPHN|nr:polysaccharide pyruvyl transferase family protein [Croceibacterium xixiisoli]MXO99111.1 hypothetical protein [Croceibacterium xixiisoli]